MTRRFTQWLAQKWVRTLPEQLLRDYQVTFGSLEGQRVLQHLLNETYCQVCPVTDPIALATHNGRRSVVQEILENIEQAERVPTLNEDYTHA